MADTFDDPVLAKWHENNEQLEHAPEWYARVQEMRNRADYYERSLLRDLYFEHGLNWREIADVLNANLASRQASRQKWKRLIGELPGVASGRRTAGAPGRRWPGGRRPSAASKDDVDGRPS